MSDLPVIPASGASLTEPQRTTAVWSIKLEVEELIEEFIAELDGWIADSDEHPPAIMLEDARIKISGIMRWLDALTTLGPPSRQALHALLFDGSGHPPLS